MIDFKNTQVDTKTIVHLSPLLWTTSLPDYLHMSATYNPREQMRILLNYEASERINFLSNRTRNYVPPEATAFEYANLLSFKKYFHVAGVDTGHFQLHHSMKSISENMLLFCTKTHVVLLNTCTAKLKKVFDARGSKSLDFDSKSGLIVATPLNKIVAKNIHSNKPIKELDVFTDNEVVSRSVFLEDRFGARLLYSVGNDPEVVTFDPITQQSSALFRGRSNTNNIDYSPEFNVYALAQDSSEIELKDDRSPDSCGLFVGHLDSNFGLAFLKRGLLASSGQDLTTRIWDIRFSQKELHLMRNETSCYNLQFSKKKNRLFALERMSRLKCVDLSQSELQISQFRFVGYTAGLGVSPSEETVYFGIKSEGIMEVGVNNL